MLKKRVRQVTEALENRKHLIELHSSLPHSDASIDPRLASRRRIERYMETASKNKKNMKEICKTINIKGFGPTGRRQKLAGILDKLVTKEAEDSRNEVRVNSIKAIVKVLLSTGCSMSSNSC